MPRHRPTIGAAYSRAAAQGGGAGFKSEDQPHAKQDSVQPALAYADAPFDALRSANPQGDRVPVASDA